MYLLYKMTDPLETIQIAHPMKSVRIRLPQVEPKKGVALRCEDLGIGYPERDVARGVRFEIERGQHVAVLCQTRGRRHEEAHTAVIEYVLNLPLDQQRVDRDDNTAGRADTEKRDGLLDRLLQPDGYAIASLEAAVQQVGGQISRTVCHLRVADPAIAVDKRVLLRIFRRGALEQMMNQSRHFRSAL